MNILRTPMDAGPAKMRRRSVRAESLSVSFMMTTAQVSTLETFINDTIRGTARFYFTHPRKSTQVETRIVPGNDGQLFTATYRAPGYWTIAMQMEILP
jgi:hypothetical protein